MSHHTNCLISYFLRNTSAKNYHNRILYVKIVVSQRWAVFLRHSADIAYCHRWSIMVCLLVGLSVTIVSCAKTVKPIEMPFWLWTLVGPRNQVLARGPDPPMWRGNFGPTSIGSAIFAQLTSSSPYTLQFTVGLHCKLQSIGTRWCELCKNGWTDRGGSNEACARYGCTLAPPDEYDWTVNVRRWCSHFCQITLTAC